MIIEKDAPEYTKFNCRYELDNRHNNTILLDIQLLEPGNNFPFAESGGSVFDMLLIFYDAEHFATPDPLTDGWLVYKKKKE
jgi:hypothetical protein